MKRKRTAKERGEMIVKGTRHLVAVGGMSNFSFPKLMAETGINAPAVYELYICWRAVTWRSTERSHN